MKLNRRQFLAGSAAALSGTVLGPVAGCAHAPPPKPVKGAALVGSQLYGWGQYYQREGKRMEDHLPEILAAIRDCGYDYAEASMDSQDPEKNARFAALLRAVGLQPVSLYTGGRFHEKAAVESTVARLLAAATVCQREGFRVINCNPDPVGRDKTDDELATQAAALDEFGKGLRRLGLKLGVHNHTPEMRNAAREFQSNLRQTDPHLVGLCYDVHWVFRGGLPPSVVLGEHRRRIVSWHLRQSWKDVWLEELTDGDINYWSVADEVREHHLPRLFSVELALEKGTQISRSVVENHRRSRDYVRKVFEV